MEPAAEDARAESRRGELRIYLGSAPGVGKTFAMLGEAGRRQDRGTDVVVGLVETHGRRRTAEALAGLEVLARRTILHEGHEFGELDTEAVLTRAPEVVLVDDLAHSNAPGAGRGKRWQDVERLLEAGIDVISTVNVQHLQSLNDVVERITGIRQQETIPDEVVRGAEQIELVDITPEALRRRLAHGNVYPADRVDAALASYFRPGNLTALRELALLWVADQVDVALQRYRAEERITDTWEARERVVVSITGGPESETLIRRGSRIAARAGAELLVLHVLRGDGQGHTRTAAVPDWPASLAGCRTLTDGIGGTFHTVVGGDVRRALLDFARGVNATQLVLGTSRRSRIARLFDEGIGAAVVQDSGSIDVHMVTHEQAGGRLRRTLARSGLSPSRLTLGRLLAVLAPALVTTAATFLRDDLDLATHVVAYLLVGVVVALVGGLGPALLASLLSALLLNFFLAEPYYTLRMDAQANIITLVVMVIAALLVSVIVDVAARRAGQASRARTEAALLASYARTVLTHPRPLERLLENVRENFGLSSVALLEKREGRWHEVAHAGEEPCAGPDEADGDVPVTTDFHLTLRGRALPASDRGALEAAAGQALLVLRQQRLASATAEAERKAEATELRTALLSAVGHDLRTPLTSIKAAAGSLRAQDIELSKEDTEELLETVEQSADRLAGLVDNLLDSSRLATGVVRPLLRPVGYEEVVAHALSTVDNTDSVVVEIDDRMPVVLADPGLLERVVANVIDNALRHGLSEHPVAVRASAHGAHAELRVVDYGRGLAKGRAESAFAPFQRLGDRSSAPGVGLGLSVAKGFTEAMGGTISAEDTPGGGLTVVISLPARYRAGGQVS